MDYKEFEKVKFYLSFHPSEKDQKVVFSAQNCFPPEVVEDKLRFYQNKYGHMSFADFKKLYDSNLPEFNRRRYHREILINEFKDHKPEDFAGMPLNKKLDYLDAFSIDMRSKKELYRDYNGAYDNLVACIWSIRPTEEFLAEERKKLNHFTNYLNTKKTASDYRDLDLLDPDKQSRTIRMFLDAFSQAYKVDKIPINYYTPKDPTVTRDGYATPGKWGINIRKDKPLGFSLEIMSILFHESTHLRQQKMYEEDPVKYRIFTPDYGKILNIARLVYGKEKEKQLYDIDFRESHAYYMQLHFEHEANVKLFKERLTSSVKLPSHLARTLWFDYQH